VRSTVLTIVMRVAVLVALAVSVSLLVDYTSTDVPYCSSSGCLGLRFKYGRVGWIPIPVFGVVAFATLLAVSLARRLAGMETLSHSLAATGGLIAALLIAMQLYVGLICVPCMIVDGAAILAGIAGAWMLFDRVSRRQKIVRAAAPKEPGYVDLVQPWAWATLGALAATIPAVWPIVRPRPPVPAALLANYQDGKINVVEFSDFECPHCRELHPRLTALVEEYGDRVHYIRLQTPLESHDRARPAARAAICAAQQGDGEAMTEELFRAESLRNSDIERMALVVGLDPDAFAACLEDPATDEQIDAQVETLAATGMVVTPSVYVGGQLIRGAKPDLVFRDAFSRAERGEDEWGLPAPAYFSAAGLLVVLVLAAGRRRERPATPESA
jgi:predicted DsbA family dithiol-disulfide isomerase